MGLFPNLPKVEFGSWGFLPLLLLPVRFGGLDNAPANTVTCKVQ